MRVGLIGLGQAGGRVADVLTYYAKFGRHGHIIPFSVVANSAKADLMGIKTIPEKDRILIGQTEVKGHGVGNLRDTGAKIAKSSMPLLVHAIMSKLKEHVDAFVMVVGMGGGTGSGMAPVLARELKNIYETPIYVLGILPSDEEGRLMANNSLQCTKELSPIVDGILFFDNNLWKREGLSLQEAYNAMNQWMVKPIPSLLGAGEAKGDRVGVKVVDAADIMNSWHGFSVLGYSELKARTLKDKVLFFHKRDSIEELNPTLRCYTVVRNAMAAGLTARCKPEEAQRGLILLSGPKSEINIEGFSQARQWLEQVVGGHEVRGGDYPIGDLNELRGLVLLSGFPDLPRLQQLRERAVGTTPTPTPVEKAPVQA